MEITNELNRISQAINNEVPADHSYLYKGFLDKGYSDNVIASMAKYNDEIITMFAQTSYRTETVERLFSAMDEEIITSDDLLHIMDRSQYPTYNESYIDDYINSIRKGDVYHQIAAQAFVISGKDGSPSYNDVIHLCSTGAYHTTPYGFLTLNHDVAKESLELGYKLRQYVPIGQSFRELNNTEQLEQAVSEGNAILWCSTGLNPYPNLPVMICSLSNDQLGYWESFKEYYSDKRDKALNGDRLKEEYYQYAYGNMLYQKVNAEYSDFISDMKNKPLSEIFNSALEIAVKKEIEVAVYLHSNELSSEQSQTLLRCDNILNEIYDEWQMSGENSLDDMISVVAQAAENYAVWENQSLIPNESRK